MNSTFIILICLLPILLFLNWTKPFREKYPDTFGYILSLVGTFVGIVLGLYFTDIQENKSNKEATVKLLQASKEELEWLMKRCDVVAETVDTLPNRKRDKFLELDMPPFFSETLRSQIMIEMLQPTSIEQLNIIKENLVFDIKMMRADFKNKKVEEIKRDKADYKKQLILTNEIIDKEIELLEGSISQETFDSISTKNLRLLME
ncbi:hypothetical protein [Flavobacterium dankookense]|uniref:Uncharacterized protein n=1 Tax=Flavobacterium dankookense TaxID=706186 RepID=A0A4R6QBW6_9FLAO|nr:hypothetical protein [Flavobacterium dankookense]TDP60244.1 hypothetical protein BC748_1224 [Flavobacterium dankookense]